MNIKVWMKRNGNYNVFLNYEMFLFSLLPKWKKKKNRGQMLEKSENIMNNEIKIKTIQVLLNRLKMTKARGIRSKDSLHT